MIVSFLFLSGAGKSPAQREQCSWGGVSHRARENEGRGVYRGMSRQRRSYLYITTPRQFWCPSKTEYLFRVDRGHVGLERDMGGHVPLGPLESSAGLKKSSGIVFLQDRLGRLKHTLGCLHRL